MQGRRLPDTELGDLPDDIQPGDFWKILAPDGKPWLSDEPGNLTKTSWMISAPTGALGTLRKHTVREHDDGMISVRPNDGSTNSIAITGGDDSYWHGYIEHGVWQQLD